MTVTADPRLSLDELEIAPLKEIDATVEVLGSKSYTNRFIAIGALSGQPVTLHNALLAQDTTLLARGVAAFDHVEVALDEAANTIEIVPTGRPMRAPEDDIFMGNAGTGLRLLITMAALAEGRTVITGNDRMRERPMGDLLDALGLLGVQATALRGNGSPPVAIEGPALSGGATRIRGDVSSQFTTSLLISAPAAPEGVEVTVVNDLVSKPYVDITVAAMAKAGVEVEREGYSRFRVAHGRYGGGDITVEPDASGMSYFLAAAAILGGRVRIPGIGAGSVQGDVALVDVLARMGCVPDREDDAIVLTGGPLRGIEVDMESMPDTAPTLAVVAAYAQGVTHITGIGNLRLKECDRIEAVSAELRKMGVEVETTDDSMTISGGAEPRGAVIDTYDDHRIAMAFAIAGLRTPGTVIRDPGCVRKSFPAFWQRLDDLRGVR
ncbi:3-phosphoshikimate 1-carboxyvinyltransferase [Actinomadura macra]|uniref:3-phosphoshikimate 1-carboxyvinyltransferase n=1 Tax=Actinomadura macra TaxID=46164 RepID=UPI0008353E0E|nr:3-phosphoshikimate 1-carboxyvinyltransferase [Actinomadura macra]